MDSVQLLGNLALFENLQSLSDLLDGCSFSISCQFVLFVIFVEIVILQEGSIVFEMV